LHALAGKNSISNFVVSIREKLWGAKLKILKFTVGQYVLFPQQAFYYIITQHAGGLVDPKVLAKDML
jgi:hypothetical protein